MPDVGGLGLPLDDLTLARIATLQDVVGPRYQGWAREPGGEFRVDILPPGPAGGPCRGFHGATLRLAVRSAIEACR